MLMVFRYEIWIIQNILWYGIGKCVLIHIPKGLNILEYSYFMSYKLVNNKPRTICNLKDDINPSAP